MSLLISSISSIIGVNRSDRNCQHFPDQLSSFSIPLLGNAVQGFVKSWSDAKGHKTWLETICGLLLECWYSCQVSAEIHRTETKKSEEMFECSNSYLAFGPVDGPLVKKVQVPWRGWHNDGSHDCSMNPKVHCFIHSPANPSAPHLLWEFESEFSHRFLHFLVKLGTDLIHSQHPGFPRGFFFVAFAAVNVSLRLAPWAIFSGKESKHLNFAGEKTEAVFCLLLGHPIFVGTPTKKKGLITLTNVWSFRSKLWGFERRK